MNRQNFLFAFLPILTATILGSLYYDLTIDDSFILYRYGQNLVDLGLWNYNPVSNPLEEAYTSFLGAGLSIFPALIGMNPKWFMVLGNFLVLRILVRYLHKRPSQNLKAAFWLVASNALVFVHFFSGMETFLFMLVLLGLFLFLLEKPESLWAPFLALILFFLRPDGFIFSLYALHIHSKKGRKQLGIATLSILLIGLYWLLRFRFFDEFYPNPVHLKSMQGFKLGIFLSNLYYAKFYLILLGAIALVAPVKRIRILALLVLATIILLYSPSRLMMNYGDRFFFQVSFPLLLLTLLKLEIPRRIVLVSIIFFNVYCLTPFQYNPLITYGKRLNDSYAALGKDLADFNDRTMVTGEGGSIPYYSGWINYDPIGLTTRRAEPDPVEFLKTTNADIIFFFENDSGDLELVPGVKNSATLNEWISSTGYQKTAHIWFSPNYRIIAFLKKGIDDEEEIRKVLKENEKTSEESITQFQIWFYGLF